MEIGNALRTFRTAKKLSQGNVERRSGLLRCCTSRVENGYTLPSLEMLEKYARAFEVPLYRFFTSGRRVKRPALMKARDREAAGAPNGAGGGEFQAFYKAISRMDDRKRGLLMSLASRLAARNRKHRL